jgi:hypothetical protein
MTGPFTVGPLPVVLGKPRTAMFRDVMFFASKRSIEILRADLNSKMGLPVLLSNVSHTSPHSWQLLGVLNHPSFRFEVEFKFEFQRRWKQGSENKVDFESAEQLTSNQTDYQEGSQGLRSNASVWSLRTSKALASPW